MLVVLGSVYHLIETHTFGLYLALGCSWRGVCRGGSSPPTYHLSGTGLMVTMSDMSVAQVHPVLDVNQSRCCLFVGCVYSLNKVIDYLEPSTDYLALLYQMIHMLFFLT